MTRWLTAARLALHTVLACSSLAACGGPSPVTSPTASGAVTTATSSSEPVASPDPCGEADAGPTTEDATTAWREGLELAKQGQAAAARCALLRARRTLERVGGAQPRLVAYGLTDAVGGIGAMVFHDALVLEQQPEGHMLEGRALLASERSSTAVLEPKLLLLNVDRPHPWPGVPGGFAVAGDETLLVRAPSVWSRLPASHAVALSPDGARAMLCRDGKLSSFDLTQDPPKQSFSVTSPAQCRSGEFAAGGSLYVESSPLVAVDPATGQTRLAREDLTAAALSPDGKTLAVLSVASPGNVPKLWLELRKVDPIDVAYVSREVAALPLGGGGTPSLVFGSDGKLEVRWQPVQAVNTYPDEELWAVIDPKTGAPLPHKKRILGGTAKAFELLAAPFRAQLKDGKRGIISPAPHDVTYAVQGSKLAVFTSAELVDQQWGPIVRDVVIGVVDPSTSKVLRRFVMPAGEPTRVDVELGPRGRALYVCLSQQGEFLFDLASGKGGKVSASCDGAGAPGFSEDGEALLTEDGVVSLAALPGGPSEVAPVARLSLPPPELFERARKSRDLRELVAAGFARCRFGPLLAPAQLCALDAE